MAINAISAVKHKAPVATEEYAVLAIDGLPIYDWIKSGISDRDGRDTTGKLVPAHVWLIDDDEARIAWKLLEPDTNGSTVVPLLVCPDDRDLSCSVVVVEQVVGDTVVEWKRFGLSRNHINGVVTCVDWNHATQSATFDRAQFEQAVLEFRRLAPDFWTE